MASTTEVVAPRPRRRRTLWPLLLVFLALAVAATSISAGGLWPVAPESPPIALEAPTGAAAVVAERPDIAVGVIAAPRPDDFDPKDQVQAIKVILPPPPPPPPVSTGARRGSSGGSSGGGGGGTSSSSGGTSYTSFCQTAKAKYGASSVSGLLSAANKERARLGIGPLSWSNSLASSAQSWSNKMASSGNFAHGGGGYSGQNIAYSQSSGSLSVSAGAKYAHPGWMDSPGHCRNIMNPRWRYMGAGSAVTDDGHRVYTTQNFG